MEVQLEIRRYAQESVTHSHPYHQMVLPLQGELEMQVAGYGGRVTGSQAAVIAAAGAHSFAGSPHSAFLVVDLPCGGNLFSTVHCPFWEAAAERPFLAVDEKLNRLIGFFAAEVARYGAAALPALAAAETLVTALERRLGMARAAERRPLARARAFIEQAWDRDICIQDIADAAGMSASRLHALFRECYGVSPKRYLAELRLGQAARLLRQTGDPITDIACRVGYSDQSAFARAFRRHYHRAPAEYRRQRRIEQVMN